MCTPIVEVSFFGCCCLLSPLDVKDKALMRYMRASVCLIAMLPNCSSFCTIGLAGAELATIANEAAISAARRGSQQLLEADFLVSPLHRTASCVPKCCCSPWRWFLRPHDSMTCRFWQYRRDDGPVLSLEDDVHRLPAVRVSAAQQPHHIGMSNGHLSGACLPEMDQHTLPAIQAQEGAVGRK